MSSVSLNIIQISDIHLLADENGELLGVNTQESFQSVIDLLQKGNDTIDMILLTGDLTQDGSEVAYKRLANILKIFNVPIYYVPGNHDNSPLMSHVYPCDGISNDRHIILKNWHLILLDSQKSHAVEGYLDSTQLNYLQHCLQSYPEHHGLIALHHQPVPVGSLWLDDIGLKNAEAFWQIILQYPNVKTILFGHVHQAFKQIVNGINCLGVPSTCIQFKPKQDYFGLEKLPPGYRFIASL